MTWRNIIVHVKPYEKWSSHLDVAMLLSKQFNAQLRGLFTCRNTAVLKTLLGEKSQTAHDVELRERELARQAESTFMQALEKAGISGDWDVGEGNASELLAFAGRAHDLIVVEQMDVEHDEPGWDVAEICAVSSGTPTLVVPCEGSFPTVGERIVVAWNGSREATTALHAAMPLIERAKHVTLLAGECKERFGSITSYPKLDILRYLERHAVEVSTRAFMASGVDAGPRMLELAEEMRCDLLVMGAYGHSAWRELFLGGATRHVLQYMTLPVLMGH